MCVETETSRPSRKETKSIGNGSSSKSDECNNNKNCWSGENHGNNREPSFLGKFSCLGVFIAAFAVWSKYTFVREEASTPHVHTKLHNYHVPLVMTMGYLLLLPVLKALVETYAGPKSGIDMKAILKPSMIFYNVAQVVINAWMVYRFVRAVLLDGHPFIGNISSTTTVYAVWVHYCNKYLEFFDTIFMVLRGKMDQVSFLHVYHHTTIAWAWWVAMRFFPGGDSYFGALLNSWIHVLMYSYYALSLLRIQCPWKRYITQAQLLQFATVVGYTYCSFLRWPDEERVWTLNFALAVQVWEMTSLFVLFTIFYQKAYAKKKKKQKQEFSLQGELSLSSATAATISKVATAALDAATEDASKIMSTAKKVPPVKKVADAASRPSWSIVS